MERQLLITQLAELLANVGTDVGDLDNPTFAAYQAIVLGTGKVCTGEPLSHNDKDIRRRIQYWQEFLTNNLTENTSGRTAHHKLSDEQILAIFEDRLLYRAQYSYLMSKYNISKATLVSVLKRRDYKWVNIDQILEQVGMTENDLIANTVRV